MAYDEGLAHRIREALAEQRDVTEKKMFGGLCFLSRGHMVAGIVGDELMLRTGPEAYAATLARPHAREMTFTGKAMKGMVYVGVQGFAEDEELRAWLEVALSFNATLPPKSKPAAKSKGRGR